MELIQKLKHKSNFKTLILGLPKDLKFDAITYDTEIKSENYKFVLIFVVSQSEIAPKISTVLKVSDPDAIIWMAYPKKASSINADINRDEGWDILESLGLRPISQVSLNDSWSAVRFRKFSDVKSSPFTKKQTFEAVISGAPDGSGGCFVKIPFDVEKVYGTKGWIRVKATFDNHPYQGSIANMGQGHILIITKEIRQTLGKLPGEKVVVTLEEDKSERIVDVPEELQVLLHQHPEAETFYTNLSYTHRKEYANWIVSAKRPETKEKRLNETLQRLLKGIKNPFIK